MRNMTESTVVVVRPKRPLRDWRLWGAIAAVLTVASLTWSLYLVAGGRAAADERVRALTTEQRCYRDAAARTTAAAANVNVDLADFVTLAIQRIAGQTDANSARAAYEEFLPRIKANAESLKAAIAAQLRAAEGCKVE